MAAVHHMKRLLILASCLLLWSAQAHAQTPQPERTYRVAKQGVLKLSVPAQWTERVRNEGAHPVIELTAKDTGAVLMITALSPPPREDAEFNTPAMIRGAIRQAMQLVQPTAVEEKLLLRIVKTTSGEGYFFTATDRAPEKGDHKYMANGGVPAGALLLSFTILSHAEPPDGIDEALKIVESAIHVPAAPR